jgi:hypothetical protein
MAYQRGSLKKVKKKEGLMWVLRYRVGGSEQTPLVVGLVADFPTEDEAIAGSGSPSTSTEDQTARAKARAGLSSMSLRSTTSKSSSTRRSPLVRSQKTRCRSLRTNVRDIIIARWGDQIAEDIEPLEIQKWFNRLHNKDEYAKNYGVEDSGHYEPNLQGLG